MHRFSQIKYLQKEDIVRTSKHRQYTLQTWSLEMFHISKFTKWFPSTSHLRKDVKTFVKTCPKCQRIKPRTKKPYGSSMPLPVPTRPWDFVPMDFITNLPNIVGYDNILTVVCTLSKMAHFIPCSSTVNFRQLGEFFFG